MNRLITVSKTRLVCGNFLRRASFTNGANYRLLSSKAEGEQGKQSSTGSQTLVALAVGVGVAAGVGWVSRETRSLYCKVIGSLLFNNST